MSVTVVGDKVLVRFEKRDEIRHGRILLPLMATEKPCHATVVAAPEGAGYGPGDEVVIAKFSGTTVRAASDPGDLTFVSTEDVLGRVERL